MKMSKILVLFSLFLLTVPLALSAPVYNVAVLDFKTPIGDFIPAGNRVYVAFTNGTASLIDFGEGSVYSRMITPLSLNVAGFFYNGSTLVLVDASGLILVLNSSSLQTLYSLKATTKSDELSISRAALSSDGRFLALSIAYTVNNVKLDRLVVVDLVKRSRIFERDVNSQDVLVKIFSLDFYQNYLVAETIDTLCELCQLTDNKIEVYSVSSLGVNKIASLQTGLTVKALGYGFILAQQVRVDDNGLHTTYVLTLPQLQIRASAKLQAIRQITPLQDGFIIVFSDGIVTKCSTGLQCTSVYSVPTRRCMSLFTDTQMVLFTVGDVSLYSVDYKNTPVLQGKYQINWTTVPFDPTIVKASASLRAAIYGSNRLVVVYPLFRSVLYLKVVTSDGNPIHNATVEISSDSKGLTLKSNSSGWATGTLPIGNYTVRVLKPGYSENRLVLQLNQPVLYATVVMSKEPPKRFPLNITIYDENGKPLPGARIVIMGPESYTLSASSEGRVFLEAVRGNYTITVEAPLYQPARRNVTLVDRGVSLNITLKKFTFDLVVTSSDNSSGRLIIKKIDEQSQPITVEVNSSSPVRRTLQAGVYQISIAQTPEGYDCRLNATLIQWSEGLRVFPVRYSCQRLQNAKKDFLSEVLRYLKNQTLISRNMSVHLDLGSITVVGGSELDLLEASRSKILVIELFYTQCTGCKYMLPALRMLSQRNDTIVVSLSVSPSDTPEVLRRYSIENNVSWYLGKDEQGISNRVNATSFPTILVVKNGTLFFMGVGAAKEIEEAKNKVSSLFNITSLPLAAVLGENAIPVTLILTGVLLIMVALIPGGVNARKKGEEEENSLSFYSSDVYSLGYSLRGDNAEALTLNEDMGREETSEETLESDEERFYGFI